MLSRFGGKRVKIEPVVEFLTRVCRLTGSFRAQVKHVIYNDLKNYMTEHAPVYAETCPDPIAEGQDEKHLRDRVNRRLNVAPGRIAQVTPP